MNDSSTVAASNDRSTPVLATILKGGGIGIVFAAVANVVIFLIGNAGAPLQVETGGNPAVEDLNVFAVLISSTLFVIIGAVGAWVFERFLPNGFRIWSIVAVVLAAASVVPVNGFDVGNDSRLAVSAMHLMVAVAAIAGHVVARRSASTAAA